MNLVDAISAHGWAMAPRTLSDLLAVAERHDAGEKINPTTLAEIVAQRNQMFLDRMNVFVGMGARLPEKLGTRNSERGAEGIQVSDFGFSSELRAPSSALEESPLAPSVVVDMAAQGKTPAYFMVENIAVVPVQGVLAKHSSMVNGMSQPTGMAYGQIARAVSLAENDPKADAILLDINSPGGMVAGVQDAYAEIMKAAKTKPVIAYAHDMAASAAYWLGAAADRIILSPTAVAGSIGVYTIHEDVSGQLADKKVKRTLIASGPYKGAGAGGLPLNADQLSAAQAEIGAMAGQFFAFVGKQRGLSDAQLATVTDGRVWIGPDAVANGLADKVVTPREAIAYAQAFASQRKRGPVSRGSAAQGKSKMEWNELTDAQISDMPKSTLDRISAVHKLAPADAKAKAKPATISELRTAFKGDADFAMDCAEKGLTLSESKAAYADVLSKRLAEADKKNQTLAQQNAELASKVGASGGAAGGVAGGGGSGDGGAETLKLAPNGIDASKLGIASGGAAPTGMAAVAARVKEIRAANKCDDGKALATLATGSAEDKALHKEWRKAGCPKL